MNKIVQLTDASGNNIYPLGYMAPSDSESRDFGGIDVNNVIAVGNGVPLPYTATQDCWFMMMAYGPSRSTINGTVVHLNSSTADYVLMPLKKGQTANGRTDDSSFRAVYGVKY